MKELPDSKIYELEMKYWPYKTSWAKVLEIISTRSPKNGTLLDVMCGPGYLLGQIGKKRKDLTLSGMDFDERYISYSKETYPGISFELGDIFSWKTDKLFNVVTCTGSVHHIPYDKQAEVVAKIAGLVKPGGFAVISDCFIDDYTNEKERKLATAKLGYEYLRETIENGAPDEAVEPAIDILWNDVMKEEFKTSMVKRLPAYESAFSKVETIKTWPEFESGYGDYISVCWK